MRMEKSTTYNGAQASPIGCRSHSRTSSKSVSLTPRRFLCVVSFWSKNTIRRLTNTFSAFSEGLNCLIIDWKNHSTYLICWWIFTKTVLIGISLKSVVRFLKFSCWSLFLTKHGILRRHSENICFQCVTFPERAISKIVFILYTKNYTTTMHEYAVRRSQQSRCSFWNRTLLDFYSR